MAIFNERTDVELKGIRFDSFCELRERIRNDDNLKHFAMLYYNGNSICGDVGISFDSGDHKKKDTILKLAGDILKHF